MRLTDSFRSSKDLADEMASRELLDCVRRLEGNQGLFRIARAAFIVSVVVLVGSLIAAALSLEHMDFVAFGFAAISIGCFIALVNLYGKDKATYQEAVGVLRTRPALYVVLESMTLDKQLASAAKRLLAASQWQALAQFALRAAQKQPT